MPGITIPKFKVWTSLIEIVSFNFQNPKISIKFGNTNAENIRNF